MLAPADADVARRDPTLPGLGLLLDPDAVVNLLRDSIPSLLPLSARPVYVRYKPGTRCLVAYEVTTPDSTVNIHANAYNIPRVLPSSPARRVEHGAMAPGRIVAAPGITLSVFPQDDTLRSLPRLWQPIEGSRLLEKLLPLCPTLWAAKLRLLAYKPGRRCVAALHGRDGTLAVVKAYTAAGFSSALSGGRAFRSRGPLRVARAMGRSRRHHVIAFEWLPGEALSTYLNEHRADSGAFKRAAAALAALHSQKSRWFREHPMVSAGDALDAVAAGIAALCPEWGSRASRLARALETALRHVADDVPLHGDFHPGQVLVGGESVGVIDMDRASRGDCRVDLATFIAHLQCEGLEGRLDTSSAERLSDALIDGYERSTDRPVRRGLEPYVAAALLRLAPRPFRTRHPEWSSLTAQILSRAEELLAKPDRRGSGQIAARSVTDPFDVLADRALSLAPEALEPQAMTRRLADLTGAGMHSATVHAIRVCRHKAGRRCLIEYDLTFDGPARADALETIVGKVRAKGIDTRTYRLSRSLWTNGFEDDSPDGISIPQPIGELPDLKMWLQGRVSGVSVTTLLMQNPGIDLARRLARAVRKLHCHRFERLPLHTVEDELRILDERLRRTIAANPSYERRLHSVLERCTRIAVTIPQVEPRGIHRDFYADQVLVHGDRVYLLDLDLYAAGDPALDIGNFLGHTTEYSLRVLSHPERLMPFENAVKECFLTLDQTVSARAIEIYKTLTLVRLIHISTTLPERRAFTDRIIDVVEARLDQHKELHMSQVASC